jgi:uncharacterized membrane protein
MTSALLPSDSSDSAAVQIGSWRFLIGQSVAVSLWVGINVLAIIKAWDPYPFVLLNLVFSVQAAYIGPVLLLSSNRAAQRDRIMAEHNYAVSEKSEQFIEGMMSELLRNSQATLAIARHLHVEIEALDEHRTSLDEKMEDVQAQLVEVEDVIKEVREREEKDEARDGTDGEQ